MLPDDPGVAEVLLRLVSGVMLGSAMLGVLSVAGPWLLRRSLPELRLIGLLRALQWTCWSSSLALLGLLSTGASDSALHLALNWLPPHVPFGSVGIEIDRMGAALLLGVTSLVGVVQHFSFRYLHRDAGHARFFFLLAVFQLGMLALVAASNFTGLIAGWELVGLSSALLIAYFHERSAPCANGVWAFASYRVCDIGLLVGLAWMGHVLGTDEFAEIGALSQVVSQHPMEIEWISLLLVLAVIGKSAQLPVSEWLPRAMEGPTPSSAIFYGALSVHAGIYLLLRTEPVWTTAPAARLLLGAVGLTTSLYAALVGRVDTDVKSRLAHASMGQVGFILVELAFGFPRLAVWHLAAHACWRTWQILRAPSALHDAHRREAFVLPRAVSAIRASRWGQAWQSLYPLRLDRFGLEARVDRFVARPVRRASRWLRVVDPWRGPEWGVMDWAPPRADTAPGAEKGVGRMGVTG